MNSFFCSNPRLLCVIFISHNVDWGVSNMRQGPSSGLKDVLVTYTPDTSAVFMLYVLEYQVEWRHVMESGSVNECFANSWRKRNRYWKSLFEKSVSVNLYYSSSFSLSSSANFFFLWLVVFTAGCVFSQCSMCYQIVEEVCLCFVQLREFKTASHVSSKVRDTVTPSNVKHSVQSSVHTIEEPSDVYHCNAFAARTQYVIWSPFVYIESLRHKQKQNTWK